MTTCAVPQDEAATTEEVVEEDDIKYQCFMFQSLKKSVLSSEEWWDYRDESQGKYKDQAQKARKKEIEAFDTMTMFNKKNVVFEYQVSEDDIIVDFNAVWGEKGFELKFIDPLHGDRKIKLRIVAWRERRKGSLKKIFGVLADRREVYMLTGVRVIIC